MYPYFTVQAILGQADVKLEVGKVKSLKMCESEWFMEPRFLSKSFNRSEILDMQSLKQF